MGTGPRRAPAATRAGHRPRNDPARARPPAPSSQHLRGCARRYREAGGSGLLGARQLGHPPYGARARRMAGPHRIWRSGCRSRAAAQHLALPRNQRNTGPMRGRGSASARATGACVAPHTPSGDARKMSQGARGLGGRASRLPQGSRRMPAAPRFPDAPPTESRGATRDAGPAAADRRRPPVLRAAGRPSAHPGLWRDTATRRHTPAFPPGDPMPPRGIRADRGSLRFRAAIARGRGVGSGSSVRGETGLRVLAHAARAPRPSAHCRRAQGRALGDHLGCGGRPVRAGAAAKSLGRTSQVHASDLPSSGSKRRSVPLVCRRYDTRVVHGACRRMVRKGAA